MPRTARSHQRAICYHVMNRGVNRNAIFHADADRICFLDLVARYKNSCSAKVYHWVLMGNHYHLLIEIAHAHLRAFVSGIQQSYAQQHHKKHQTCGVFWQGRFISKPVEIGSYLVQCGRYIERNPVRGGLAECAWGYPWSSARFYVNGTSDLITDLNPYIGELGEGDRMRYAEVLASGADDDFIHGQRATAIIGGSDFRNSLKKEQGHYRLKKGRPLKPI